MMQGLVFEEVFAALTSLQLDTGEAARLRDWFAAACRVFARDTGIAHEAITLRAGSRARGAIHLNHVNGWHARFKTWLRRFNGIASRYLVNYSGWQRLVVDGELRTPAQLLTATIQYAICRRKITI